MNFFPPPKLIWHAIFGPGDPYNSRQKTAREALAAWWEWRWYQLTGRMR